MGCAVRMYWRVGKGAWKAGWRGCGVAVERSRRAGLPLTRTRQRLGLRAASLGATPLSQAGRQDEAEDHSSARESGAADAGLRRASLSPQSKTLLRGQVPQTFCRARGRAGCRHTHPTGEQTRCHVPRRFVSGVGSKRCFEPTPEPDADGLGQQREVFLTPLGSDLLWVQAHRLTDPDLTLREPDPGSAPRGGMEDGNPRWNFPVGGWDWYQ